MAATTTVTATELIYAKILSDVMIDAMYSVEVMEKLVRLESLVGKPSNSMSFDAWPSLTAAAIAETADLVSTAVDTTNIDIAVTEAAAIRIDVTDLLIEAAIIRDGMRFAEQGGKAVADKRDTDLAALLAGFSVVVGTTNTVLSEANLLAAMTALTNADAPRPYAGVLHTKQLGDLRVALAATAAAVWSTIPPDTFGPNGKVGYEFTYYTIPLYATTNVATANAGVDRAGAIFCRDALARVDKRPIRYEPQRDASLRATEHNITSVYGQGELVDGWGVSVITKA